MATETDSTPAPATNWLLLGSNFRLPVKVSNIQGTINPLYLVILHPELTWLPQWIKAAGAFLSANCFSHDQTGWWILPNVLEGIAAQIPDTHAIGDGLAWLPETVTVELPREKPRDEKDDSLISESAHAFLRAFVDETGSRAFTTVESLTIFWRLLTHYMPIWMLKHDEPLDLGFCKLFASTLRVGWQYPFHHETMNRKRNDEKRRKRALTAEESELLLGFNRLAATGRAKENGDTCQWRRLEVNWSTRWEKLVEQIDKPRAKTCRSYLKLLHERQEKVLPLLVENYAQFAGEKKLPHVSACFPGFGFRTFAGTFSYNLQQSKASQAHRFGGPLSNPVYIAHRKNGKVQQPPLPEANAPVPAVPSVQPESTDVRDSGRIVAESGDPGI